MKKIYFWLIGAGVIILILGGFLYYRYHKNKNNSSTTSTQTATTVNTNNNSKTKPSANQTTANNQAVNDTNFKAAETAYQQKDYTTALSLITQEVASNPTAVAYNLWGNILRDSGDSATAQAKYEQAISLDASYISAYINLSTIYQQNGNIDKAKEILNQGLVANPDNSDLQNSLGALEIVPTTGN